MYGAIGEKCWAASCQDKATHVVTMRILADDNFPEYETEVAYCLKDALYFAAWLPYCYSGEQELVSINPPASELFS